MAPQPCSGLCSFEFELSICKAEAMPEPYNQKYRNMILFGKLLQYQFDCLKGCILKQDLESTHTCASSKT